MTVVMCPNVDCRPGCGNSLTQALMDAMLREVPDQVVCPSCGTVMVYLSRMIV